MTTEDRLTVGVLTPHRAAGPEVELPSMSGGRVATVVSRTEVPGSEEPGVAPPAHAALLASMDPAAADRAAVAFGDRRLAAVVHASTTSGYLVGHRDEAALVGRLAERFGVPAVASCMSVVAALRAHGVGRVQLVHPPWFDDELDGLGATYFGDLGLDVVVTRAPGLPRDPARVDRRSVVDAVEHLLDARAEAVFLAGNGFRAADAVNELELRTGRLVVSANQALLWGILQATRRTWHVPGHGRLLVGEDAAPPPA